MSFFARALTSPDIQPHCIYTPLHDAMTCTINTTHNNITAKRPSERIEAGVPVLPLPTVPVAVAALFSNNGLEEGLVAMTVSNADVKTKYSTCVLLAVDLILPSDAESALSKKQEQA